MIVLKGRGLLAAIVICAAVLAAAGAGWAWKSSRGKSELDANNAWVEIERVRAADSLIGDSHEKIRLAGIRAPLPGEPLFEESKNFVEELVAGEDVRLRFDQEKRDKKGRYLAYVFIGDDFLNFRLVREGLAYVRLTTVTRRYADDLLAAQSDARREKRGLWREQTATPRSEYWADPKYGNFHGPDCAERGKGDPARMVTLRARDEAFERGFAPCAKCKP